VTSIISIIFNDVHKTVFYTISHTAVNDSQQWQVKDLPRL